MDRESLKEKTFRSGVWNGDSGIPPPKADDGVKLYKQNQNFTPFVSERGQSIVHISVFLLLTASWNGENGVEEKTPLLKLAPRWRTGESNMLKPESAVTFDE